MGQRYTSIELIRLIEADGWFRVGVRGSHWQFKHPTKPGRVTVPHPRRDVAKGTAAMLMGESQPNVSAIVRRRLQAFSLERLIHRLQALGFDLEMTIKSPAAGRKQGNLTVRMADSA